MASIRDTLMLALVARLDAINGWAAQLRGAVNLTGDNPIMAIVAFVGEDKRLAGSTVYAATMNVEVLVTGRTEDADPTLDGGNPYRYLDRLVVQVEKAVHTPDSWGVSPDFTDVVVNGHEVLDPSEDNEVAALVRIQFTYRHDYQNPEA